MPAEVAAVLENLTADTALIDSLVLPELFYQLAPYTMSTGENYTSFDGHGGLMSKPNGLEKGRQGLKGIPQLAKTRGVLCSASGRRGGAGAFSLPRRPPGYPLEAADSECSSLQITFAQHKEKSSSHQPQRFFLQAPQRNII